MRKLLLSVLVIVTALAGACITPSAPLPTLTPMPTPVPVPTQTPTPTPTPMPITTPTPTPTQSPTSASPAVSPPITIALDYFGIQNTHWISQVGGDLRAKIQLLLIVKDERQNLAVRSIPPEGIPGFEMDFFQVRAIKENMSPEVFTGSANGCLTVFVAAYNVNKGPITKAQMDMLSNWLGLPELGILKAAVPDRELVGYYWHTWLPSESWGVGRHDEQGEEDLKVWLRIGSSQMPSPAQQPVLKPNVKVEASLPNNARVRTPLEYRESLFTLTLINNESFKLPLHWRIETPANPGATINFRTYPTMDIQSVPDNGRATVSAKYWFTVPGSYQWKYIVECPKGNQIASWVGILNVLP